MITGIKSQDDVCGVFTIFSEIWGDETLSELVSSIHHTKCIVNKIYGEVCGYLFYEVDERDGAIEITDFGVADGLQNKGFGRQLLEHILDLAHHEVKLTVRTNNESAHFLYSKLGFKEIHRYENYYGVGQDGYRMLWTKGD
jgi:ribosomal protein S18 acetylase RimI-like enzyme